MNLDRTRNVISLLESASGVTHSDKPDGRMTAPSGQVHALANLSARQAKEKGLLMSGTYGPHSPTLFNSAVLSQSLVSKLKLLSGKVGSTLYKLTWRESVTKLGCVVFRLAASGHRTSDSACTSWPTPQTFDAGNGGTPRPLRYKGNAPSEQGNTRNPDTLGSYRGDLKDYAALSSWPTPTAAMSKQGSPNSLRGKGQDLMKVMLAAAQLADSGAKPIGSSAVTGSIGQLNPAHSRWLMGLPTAWDDCAVMVTRLSRRSQKPSSGLTSKGRTFEN